MTDITPKKSVTKMPSASEQAEEWLGDDELTNYWAIDLNDYAELLNILRALLDEVKQLEGENKKQFNEIAALYSQLEISSEFMRDVEQQRDELQKEQDALREAVENFLHLAYRDGKRTAREKLKQVLATIAEQSE